MITIIGVIPNFIEVMVLHVIRKRVQFYDISKRSKTSTKLSKSFLKS